MSILILLLAVSCTHAPVRILPGDCPTRAVFVETKNAKTHSIQYQYWSFTEPEAIYISEVLKSGPHQCQALSEIDWQFKQNFFDVVLSLFPFASRGQVILNYSLE